MTEIDAVLNSLSASQWSRCCRELAGIFDSQHKPDAALAMRHAANSDRPLPDLKGEDPKEAKARLKGVLTIYLEGVAPGWDR